ncbi:glutamine cyclotransferase [Rhodococcus sp. 27YEA15]|uniref:glutaminyl-peptide cyclotransferase n=1 Tax=Rhodococcus sp. 27YEA15 TaxID=3156259 RepID=UPI003C7B2083
MTRFRAGSVFAVVAASLTSCLLSGCTTESSNPPDALGTDALTVQIVQAFPHDPDAFTQGLEIDGDRLYESTGRVGQSWVRSNTITDPDAPTSGPEVARADLEAPLFGEGITVHDDILWQLTWKNGVAIARDKNSLTELRRVRLDTEGWGICSFADRLITSDGSAVLTVRDPKTFDPLSTVSVARNGVAVDNLNELECAEDGKVLANVWTTDTIVEIDPADGTITATIDASPLRNELDTTGSTRPLDVLNGIAQIPGTDRFLLTGKYWPQMFEVRFVA